MCSLGGLVTDHRGPHPAQRPCWALQAESWSQGGHRDSHLLGAARALGARRKLLLSSSSDRLSCSVSLQWDSGHGNRDGFELPDTVMRGVYLGPRGSSGSLLRTQKWPTSVRSLGQGSLPHVCTSALTFLLLALLSLRLTCSIPLCGSLGTSGIYAAVTFR